MMHVGLEYPREKRKDILNSAIDILELLKKYERVKKLRREKESQRRQLRVLTRDIKLLIKEISEMMPRVELPKEEKPKKEEKTKVAVKEAQMPKQAVKKEVKKDQHIGKLERDLNELRDKIARL